MFVGLLLTLTALSSLCLRSRLAAVQSPRNKRRANIYLSLLTLLGTMLSIEIASKHILCESDSFGFTLSAQCWNDKYWQPINEQGFRDEEWRSKNLHRNKKIVVTGDSFVAGTGIKKIEQRFPEQLLARLGNNYSVVALAKKGWGPLQQTAALNDFPFEPEIIIHSYFVNDIEGAYLSCNRRADYSINRPPGYGSWYVKHSHLINSLYWRTIRHFKSGIGANYWKGINSAFEDPTCFSIHAKQLRDLLSAGKAKDALRIAVLFPDLRNIDGSREILKKVATVFAEEGVRSINLTEHLKNWSVDDLIVNNLDSHPSERLHKYVAEQIAIELDGGN